MALRSTVIVCMGLVAASVTLASEAPDTLALAIEVDREGARVTSYVRKERPFPGGAPLPVEPYRHGRPTRFEVVQRAEDGAEVVTRVDLGPLCLRHGPEEPPHIHGDTILVHRDMFRVDVPAVSGRREIEIAYYEEAGRRPLLREDLPDPSSFLASTALWPEDFSDPDIYRVYGDESEAGERVNVVIVPDGYPYAEKAEMEQDAQAFVDYVRGVTPYKEHDVFINYILVYAYSVDSGTDQCDCGIEVDTVMGTRFPDAGDSCGGSGNRCLYYGGGCDVAGTSNIVAAELRAPLQDETIVMVNTTRYGGCGGARSVYSAGNSSATDIAVHELGHSWAGLADEYQGNSSCGGFAGEINTSTDAAEGAWSEWIDDLGPPTQGGQYYNQCIYRPEPNCEMRALHQPFCKVCRQHWSLVTFGHPRVAPTAPVRGQSPASSTTTWTQVPQEFSIDSRFSVGAGITNRILWQVAPPGSSGFTIVASGVTELTRVFDIPGLWQVQVEVVADTNFVKPEKWGANRDVVSWSVDVSELVAPDEVPESLGFSDPSTMSWVDVGAPVFGYNVYRGDLTSLDGVAYGDCHRADLTDPTVTDLSEVPDSSAGWYFLVSGANPAGEGSLGQSSTGAERAPATPCP